ncbi:MAG: polysaccharide deacetylase family protein [Bacteroidota bacterium]
MQTLLVYTVKSSPRIEYVVSFLAKAIFQCDWRITNNAGDLEKHDGPVLNYSKNQIMDFVRIHPHKIMLQEKIEKKFIKVDRWKNIPVFFETDSFATIPYDLLACTFYLITRYEEYTVHSFDEHGRFRHQDSLAYRYGFLNRPVVDEWAYTLKDAWQRTTETPVFNTRKFEIKPSLDIDNAFAFKHKPWTRHFGNIIKQALTGNIEAIKTRMAVLSGKENDPYDTYGYMIKQLTGIKEKTPCFLLYSKHGKYDTNLPQNSMSFKDLIKTLGQHFDIGLHPSYQSNKDERILLQEKKALENVTGHSIEKSRQHFLAVRIPDTYNKLIGVGISHDYSMGYAGTTGFRAGTCSAFPFFNLEENKSTELIIHPFAYMDVTLEQYLRLNPEEAMEAILKLADAVKKVDGTLMFIWHNESLSELGQWKGWRRVFEYALKIT